jgi:aspartate racemase
MATVDLFAKIIQNTEADGDGGHIHILIDNDPRIPDRTAALLGNGENPLPFLTKASQGLQAMGADFLVIPCNTAHGFYDELQENLNIEILHMIRITAKYCAEKNYHMVGLLSTKGTIKTNIYQAAFEKYSIQIINPTDGECDVLMEYIYTLKAGRAVKDTSSLANIAERMRLSGAEAVIMGCTELPIIMENVTLKIKKIDPTLLLARAAVLKAGGILPPAENKSD